MRSIWYIPKTVYTRSKVDRKKSVEEYNASKRFDILSIGDVEKLVKKRKTKDKPILYFIPNEDLKSCAL